MTYVRKATGRAVSVPAGVGIGTLCAMSWTFLGAMITAYMVEKEIIPEKGIGYGALVILMTAAFLTGKVSYQKIKHRKAMVTAVSGLTYFLVLIAINALFFGGQYSGVGVTAAAILAGCTCSILLGNGIKKKPGWKPHKRKGV